MVARRFLMSHAQVPRKWLLQNNNPWSLIGRPLIEWAQDSCNSRHLKRPHGSYPAWNFGYKKAAGVIGTAFANSGQQAQRKKCSSTMTMHRLTPPLLPRPNLSNCTMHCFPSTVFSRLGSMHFFNFQTWKSNLPGRNLSRIRRSSLPWMPTLHTSRNHIF